MGMVLISKGMDILYAPGWLHLLQSWKKKGKKMSKFLIMRFKKKIFSNYHIISYIWFQLEYDQIWVYQDCFSTSNSCSFDSSIFTHFIVVCLMKLTVKGLDFHMFSYVLAIIAISKATLVNICKAILAIMILIICHSNIYVKVGDCCSQPNFSNKSPWDQPYDLVTTENLVQRSNLFSVQPIAISQNV